MQEIEGGQVAVNYIRTLNNDEPLARLTTDSSRFYMQDALGSVIGLTDTAGVVCKGKGTGWFSEGEY